MIHTAGEQLKNRYEIVAFVGAGGMQEVYQARDGVFGDRIVALKTPKGQSGLKRFERSAIVSARVNHPNVAKTLDYFVIDERPYLVEEYIEGQDLHKVMRQIPCFDTLLTAHLLHHIAKGLAASHHAGVIHRDLKPGNIMLSPTPNFETIKITDFGIAKMAEAELAIAAKNDLTTSQTALGALPYLAPEMIRTPDEARKPADIWALGAMTFEFLTGAKPFGTGFLAVPKILDNERAEIPKTQGPQFQGLFTEIEQVVTQCLSPLPGDRPDADELVALCGNLCYATSQRFFGWVEKTISTFGFITEEHSREQVFFHSASVYGEDVSADDRVCYAKYSGKPHARAYPVIKINDL